jgi:hypothetical protein
MSALLSCTRVKARNWPSAARCPIIIAAIAASPAPASAAPIPARRESRVIPLAAFMPSP